MKKYSNFILSVFLWLSHFLTDALAAFVLITIVIKSWSRLAWITSSDAITYFFLYNFFAFFLQIFLWHFFDKLWKTTDFFRISKISILISFIFYPLWVLFLYSDILISVTLVWIGSCLFHLWGGNIALSSDSRKASHLGVFASWWVIGLSFWGFIAINFPLAVILILGILLLLWIYISIENRFVIDTLEYNKREKKEWEKAILLIVFWLWFVLIARSGIWTHFQEVFSDNSLMLIALAIVAFFGKIIWGFVQDLPKFSEKYLGIVGFFALTSLILYSFIFNNLWFLFFWIFWIQFFISPFTYILYKYIPERKSMIIGFTFGCSLVLGYILSRLL